MAFAVAFADPDARAAHALELLKGGKVWEAAAQFRAVLAVQPEHGLSLLNLGVICTGFRRMGEAADLFERAAAAGVAPGMAYWQRSGVFLTIGQYDKALIDIDKALSFAPSNHVVWLQRAAILRELRRFAEADACLQKVLQITGPDAGEAENPDLGETNGPAMAPFAAMLPDHGAEVARAALLSDLRRHGDALEAYDRLLQAAPDDRQLRHARSVALANLRRPEEALAALDVLLAETPDDLDILGTRTLLLLTFRRAEEALACVTRGLALAGETPVWLSRKALALAALFRFEEALAYLDRAVLAEPYESGHFMNRGHLLVNLGRPQEGLANTMRAIALKPDSREALFNRACTRLLLGDFEGGWKDYECRWYAIDNVLPAERVPLPVWDGLADLTGKTILLSGEQGMGDVLQFLRFAEIVAARGARVVVWVHAPLARLAAGFPGVSEVIAVLPAGRLDLPIDLHSPLLSLPLLLGTRLETIPPPPRVTLDAAEFALWRERLGPCRRPRVGIAWSGNPAHANDRQRSMTLAQVLSALPDGVEVVSLQKEIRPEDEVVLAERDVRDVAAELNDMADTAALISGLDLVVSVDTSVAHLAGTLGVRTLILLAFAPDWRWLCERADSPWYPSVRLFRQNVRGDWSAPLAEARAAVEELCRDWQKPDAAGG